MADTETPTLVVEHLDVKPGDHLLVRLPEEIPSGAIKRIAEQFEKEFPDNRLVVLAEGIELTVESDGPEGNEREDGLTADEGIVMDALCDAANAFGGLPVEHPSDPRDFCDAIHKCQDLLAVRIARRHYPIGWPVKAPESVPPPPPLTPGLGRPEVSG
ncbi:MAG TPA: hypothetical protein VMS11_04720 [Solirubrobacterales bacterium]|nr:hypothetical protein [Solirubrobacterales bacterium]